MESVSMSRRDFLNKSSLSVASFAFLKDLKFSKKSAANLKNKEVIYRTLGKTGIKLPIVSAGALRTEALVKEAYELGVRHFDTALDYYGLDIILGYLINDMGIRDELFVTSKVPLTIGAKQYIEFNDYTKLKETMGADADRELKNNILKMCDECLKRMNLEYFDYFALHYVIDPEMLELPPVIEAMTKIKKDGKARFLGVSTHKREILILNKMIETKIWDIGLIGINYKYKRKEESLKAIKNAVDSGMGIIAMKTQGIVREPKDYKTHHTAGLKWVLQNDFITTAIPSCSNFEQLENNCACAKDLNFNEEEAGYLKNYFDNRTGYFLQCEQCEECIGTCPKDADVPDLMRTYMYAAGYNDFVKARYTYNQIPEEKNLSNCTNCNDCTAKCSGGLDLVTNIKQLKAIYGFS